MIFFLISLYNQTFDTLIHWYCALVELHSAQTFLRLLNLGNNTLRAVTTFDNIWR